MEGRTAGDPRPLHQHGVAPAQPGKPVEDRRSAHTPTDDDRASVRPQVVNRGPGETPDARVRHPYSAAMVLRARLTLQEEDRRSWRGSVKRQTQPVLT